MFVTISHNLARSYNLLLVGNSVDSLACTKELNMWHSLLVIITGGHVARKDKRPPICTVGILRGYKQWALAF